MRLLPLGERGERARELDGDAIVAEDLTKVYYELAERIFDTPTPIITRALRGKRPTGIEEEAEEEDDDDEGLDEEEAAPVEIAEEEREAAVWALRGVSLRVPRGETLGLVGSSGSGKTTLLRVLAGAVPPSSGRALLAGRPAPLLNLAVQLMITTYGPEANARVAAALVGMPRRRVRERMEEILDLAEVSAKDRRIGITRAPYKVAVGVALGLGTEVLLLDDPFASTTEAYRERILETIERRQAEGTTILIETRDREALRRLCTRAAWLDRGELAQLGPVDEILAAHDAASLAERPAAPVSDVATGFNETAAIVSAHAETDRDGRAVVELRLELARSAMTLQTGIGLERGDGTGLWFEQPDPVVCELPGFHRFRLVAHDVPPGLWSGRVQARVLEGGDESVIARRDAFSLQVGDADERTATGETRWERREGSWLYESEQSAV